MAHAEGLVPRNDTIIMERSNNSVERTRKYLTLNKSELYCGILTCITALLTVQIDIEHRSAIAFILTARF